MSYEATAKHESAEKALSGLNQSIDSIFDRAAVMMHSVSNQQKWDTLGAERSGAGWRAW